MAKKKKKKNLREFPGSPEVRTLCFHCRGLLVRSLVTELRFHKLCGAAKKRKKRKKMFLMLAYKRFTVILKFYLKINKYLDSFQILIW